MLFRTGVVAALSLVGCVFASADSYSFHVTVVGHGKPLILIPGLSCGPNVWDTTVARYKDRFECHLLTLPGFAGQPPIEAPILPKVKAEIIAYIKDKHLDHPIIIGHSLGGTMALKIAAESPSSVGKVISVDGPPWLPALQDSKATMKDAVTQANTMKSMFGKMDESAYVKGNKTSLGYMVTAPKDIEFILSESSKSDPKSVGEAMYELYSTDSRPEMAKVKCPVLMLAEGFFFTTPELRKSAMESYEAQIHAIPNHVVKMSTTAKHFIMLDDPKFYFAELDKFLSK